jgi:hypothetical protein
MSSINLMTSKFKSLSSKGTYKAVFEWDKSWGYMTNIYYIEPEPEVLTAEMADEEPLHIQQKFHGGATDRRKALNKHLALLRNYFMLT